MEGFSQTQISTLAVNDNFLVAGGFQGELTCKVSPHDLCLRTSCFFGHPMLDQMMRLFYLFVEDCRLSIPYLLMGRVGIGRISIWDRF
jgi:hypothetical protein